MEPSEQLSTLTIWMKDVARAISNPVFMVVSSTTGERKAIKLVKRFGVSPCRTCSGFNALLATLRASCA